ncbi:glycosyltransferase [Chroococcus sp. FPU101]|uniref:glycosyltransferase n=1 Tax=Chroococcus sp. FPU101 TaxID=1974212 RepID=UPI001A8FD898|nr:glycosyltransferase [Chroococcus sp. FPU101]
MFFVNSAESEAAGIRAKLFAERLSSRWEICFNYRPVPKWKGIVTFVRSALHFRPHIIYVMDTAYTGVLAGYMAKKLLGCKLITDTGDVAYELAKSTGNYSQQQLALIHWVEQLAIAYSDCLIVRGSYHQNWLEKQGIQNVFFVPDGVKLSSIKSVDVTSLKTELGLIHHLVVGVVGTLTWSDKHQMCYGWDIIEALSFLKDLPIKALIVGDGNGRSILQSRAEELGVADRVIFTGQIPYDELSRYLCAMDICVSTQSNDLVGMVRTTGKLPLYLAYGKYVIATDVGEAKKVLPAVGCLLPYDGVRDNHHPFRLAQQLKKLLAQPKLLEITEPAKQVARSHFDYDLLASKVERICCDLVKLNS